MFTKLKIDKSVDYRYFPMLFVAYFHFVKKCKPYRVYTVRCYMLRFLVTVTIYLSFSNAVARFGEPGRRNRFLLFFKKASDIILFVQFDFEQYCK